ncbi:MAG TPA: hypothetical protein VMD09_11195 [Solirubrobacteraceae bacterium]|nr:hypothetical protein [Solirubrobacteraceae bacterium]
MRRKQPSRIADVLGRVEAAWADMNHAQRRLFEIRTGIDPGGRSRPNRTIAELEALYAIPPAKRALNR